MCQSVADSLRHMRRVAVKEAYKLAPDAEALAANDQSWWHKEELAFAGRKFSTNPPLRSTVERIKSNALISTGTNSGLLAVHVAISLFGATRVELYGVDMRGTHYFGPHVGRSGTKPERFEIFKQQFERYGKSLPKGVSIVNCTPGSALTSFPFA
jgi:hypothetical protein